MNTLWENPPAVDHDRLTRDVACGVGGRETATLATSGLAVAPERDALQVLGVLGGIREQVVVARPTDADPARS